VAHNTDINEESEIYPPGSDIEVPKISMLMLIED